MEKQKTRSRAAAEQETGDWVMVNEDESVEFVGYDTSRAKSRIINTGRSRIKKETDSNWFWTEHRFMQKVVDRLVIRVFYKS
jgi:hypothetical protein